MKKIRCWFCGKPYAEDTPEHRKSWVQIVTKDRIYHFCSELHRGEFFNPHSDPAPK